MSYPRTHNLFGSTFGGVCMRQYWADLALWELFLNAHPEIRTVVELGAFHGGFTLFMAAETMARGQGFYTLDRDWPAALDTPLADALGLRDVFVLGDFWQEAHERLLALLRDPGLKPLCLFVDGGNKAAEFAAFTPELAGGDYVAVHDWGTEFQKRNGPDDVAPVAHLLAPEFWDECEAPPQPCLTRFWKVRP